MITVLLTATTRALVAAGLATSFPMLLIASLASGATSVVAQILVPFAAGPAPGRRCGRGRCRVVGRVMSGLLTGVLLSRTLSSLVSASSPITPEAGPP